MLLSVDSPALRWALERLEKRVALDHLRAVVNLVI